MLFNSYSFVFLVIVTFGLYYFKPLAPLQRFFLILASMVFYAANQPILLLLLASSIVINFTTSYFVIKVNPNHRKRFAAIGVILNISILVFFKYSPLFGRSIFYAIDSVEAFLVMIPLPIGISFFTFQGISLLMDVHRRDKYAFDDPESFFEHSVNVSLYLSFFAQLVAGPIVKAHIFLPQIKTKMLRDINWESCFRSLTLGYFLKMFVADNLKDFTFWISYPYFISKSSFELLMMLFGYSMQIFADFAGYSLIAIGIAGLFGYRLPQNFNFPYISKSFSEFWTRWHISLSSFLKEYLYFSLGGNRKGKSRIYLNLFIVMFLGGLWHGAAWGYAVWGMIHGIALAIERFLKDFVRQNTHIVFKLFQVVGVFVFVSIAWLFFKLPVISHAWVFLETLVENRNKGFNVNPYILIYSAPVILYHLHYVFKDCFKAFAHQYVQAGIYGGMLFLILTNSGSPGAFVYFQF
jgi:alginate O-acetyltransferase complex protein AlgI